MEYCQHAQSCSMPRRLKLRFSWSPVPRGLWWVSEQYGGPKLMKQVGIWRVSWFHPSSNGLLKPVAFRSIHQDFSDAELLHGLWARQLEFCFGPVGCKDTILKKGICADGQTVSSRNSKNHKVKCKLHFFFLQTFKVVIVTTETCKMSVWHPDPFVVMEWLAFWDCAGFCVRYERQQIYTWLGDVLVSVNPYSNVGAFDEAARLGLMEGNRGQVFIARGNHNLVVLAG